MHSGIHTAFAFEHDVEPFYIRVEIQGKLQKRSDRLKENMKQLLKFPPDSKKDQGTSLTLVHLDQNRRTQDFKKQLDQIAQGLPLDMERLNFANIPMQVPDALPVSFQDGSQATDPLGSTTTLGSSSQGLSSTGDSASSATLVQDTTLRVSPGASRGITSASPLLGIPVSTRGSHLDTEENERINRPRIDLRNQRESEKSSKQREAPPRAEAPPSEPAIADPRVEMKEKVVSQNKDAQEILNPISQSPGLIVILQWFIYVFGMLPMNISRKFTEKAKPQHQ